MTLEETIEQLESMISNPQSWERLTKCGAGMTAISFVKWLKELRIYRERFYGVNQDEN